MLKVCFYLLFFQINISHQEYTDKLNLYLDMIRERELIEYNITQPGYYDVNDMINGSKRLFQFNDKSKFFFFYLFLFVDVFYCQVVMPQVLLRLQGYIEEIRNLYCTQNVLWIMSVTST